VIKFNPFSSRIQTTLSSKRWRKFKEEGEHCKLQRKTTRAHIVIRRITFRRIMLLIIQILLTKLPQWKRIFRIIHQLLRKRRTKKSHYNWQLKVQLLLRIFLSNSKSSLEIFWQMFNKIVRLNKIKSYSIVNKKLYNNSMKTSKPQIQVQTSKAS